MNKRQIKKLNKKSMDLLIGCGLCPEEDFDLFSNDWIIYVTHEAREECWTDEVEPFAYLTGLVQDTLVEYIEVEDDSEYGFHIEESWTRNSNLSVIDVFAIFRNTYGLEVCGGFN
ncbi:hypothetical protein B9T31_12245 [Acinetobacter sp. ANC 4558]|uniref:hypothetical protein n=1 Tax=Acinetobacter sp. ANC 4558 TaxID=1977876 RepID=UPI000A337E36|nr:hypothetical protein [Acinetobacter sp. ANC 4558]OTG85554.1 hypothetical protein B9T31_12245 [Acinetobacter sp. ANC 4558]